MIGATEAVLDYIGKHDNDFTATDIRKAYKVNKNSVHSAFTTLESNHVIIRKNKVNGVITWGKPSNTDADRAWKRFERLSAEIMR